MATIKKIKGHSHIIFDVHMLGACVLIAIKYEVSMTKLVAIRALYTDDEADDGDDTNEDNDNGKAR